MYNREQYKAVFSQVRTSRKIEMEVFEAMKPKFGMKKRGFVLAAAVCLVFTCSVTAFAMNLFGMQDLVLKQNPGDHPGQISGQETRQPVEMISLQGFSNSNEFKAIAEWSAFLDSYDQDGKILSQVGNGPTDLDEKYSLYHVYSQEMVDKLEEIISKYNLALHQSMEIVDGVEELFGKAGTEEFLGTGNIPYSSYVYEDGTFRIDGSAVLSTGQKIEYQLVNCKKGSFTDIILNIGDMSDYEEWLYTTSSGVTVNLSLSSNKALVFTDLKNSFVSITVLAGTEEGLSGTITALDLEAFTDTFDFSKLN